MRTNELEDSLSPAIKTVIDKNDYNMREKDSEKKKKKLDEKKKKSEEKQKRSSSPLPPRPPKKTMHPSLQRDPRGEITPSDCLSF